MESVPILTLLPTTVETVLNHARTAEPDLPGLTTFSGLPTAMLFRPDPPHGGSLHYMFFSAPAEQRLHCHPGSRCLLILGDVDVHVSHAPGTAARHRQEVSTLQTLCLPKCTLSAIRFSAYHWHRFETRDRGTGVLVFSFHGDDRLPPGETASTNLMEELTYFWDDNDR